MKIIKEGIIIIDSKKIEINGWTINGGNAQKLKKYAIRKAFPRLLKAWLLSFIIR